MKTPAEIEASIAARWESMARADGWQQAECTETGALVVFHEDKAHHYTGPDAWKLAAMHEDCPCCKVQA